MSLLEEVEDYESVGCTRVDHSLGIQKMPDGYALMIDGDWMYFFWLAADGRESVIHWNKWAVWRGAKLDSIARGRAMPVPR